MNDKTRPQSRPSGRTRARGMGQPSAQVEPRTRPKTLKGRIRRFAPAVGIPVAIIALLSIIAALVGVMATSSHTSVLAAVIADIWMGVHTAPITYQGTTVGLLPILPALGIVALMSRRIRRAVSSKVSVIDLGVLLGLTVAIPVVLTIIAWFMVWDAGKVYKVSPPPLWDALARVIVVYATSFVIGIGPKLWRALAKRYNIKSELIDGYRLANRFLISMAGWSLLVMLALVITGWDRQRQMADAFPNHSGIALAFLTILYLPNALVYAASVLLGGEFHLGDATVTLYGTHLVPLPPTPLTALIPGQTAQWEPVLLLVPALAAAVIAYKARPTAAQALGAGVTSALVVAVVTYLCSGKLGIHGHSGPMWWLAIILAALWPGAIGLAAAGVDKALGLRSQE